MEVLAPKSTTVVFSEILAHIQAEGGESSSWYCGITSDWGDRLFNEHNVPRDDNHPYIASQCHNNDSARIVETNLLKLGCDGGKGGGDSKTVYVYAYLKGTKTNP